MPKWLDLYVWLIWCNYFLIKNFEWVHKQLSSGLFWPMMIFLLHISIILIILAGIISKYVLDSIFLLQAIITNTEFIIYCQCYDRYSLQNLRKAANLRGHSFWARGPDNTGYYNSRPHETGFFCERGDYDSYYGRFFLQWYTQVLIDHADKVLSLASLAFEETQIVVKVCKPYMQVT